MPKLSYDSAVALLRAGDRVMVTHPDPNKATDRTRYNLVTAGGGLTASTWRKLQPHLAPVKDGLFDASQTFAWAGD